MSRMSKQKPKSMIEIIKEAGYVMVVRCKDCAFYTDSANCPVFGMDRYGDWFCADGERKESGEQDE